MLLLSRLPQGQTYGGTNRRFPERSSDIAGRAKYLLTISVSREKKKKRKKDRVSSKQHLPCPFGMREGGEHADGST